MLRINFCVYIYIYIYTGNSGDNDGVTKTIIMILFSHRLHLNPSADFTAVSLLLCYALSYLLNSQFFTDKPAPNLDG